ncbi:MAG: IS630 family transposase [Opitutaceae bacterium]|nr:IS630 family transposase [Opitutaceae bacterium]
MARKLPPLGEELVKEIEAAWEQPQADWARQRLLVVRLIAQHELTTEQIAKVAGVSRKSVFNYRDKVERGGVAELLTRDWAGARTPAVRGAVAEEFIARLEAGQFRQAKDAQAWIKKRTRKTLSVSGALKVLRRLGGKLKVPRKSHAKKDPVKAAKFKVELPARLREVAGSAPTQPVRVWVLDEHRYGLLPVIRRVWGRRGVRVHAPYATRYQWGYLHEALEVDGAHAVELLFTPAIDRDIHALFLQQIADSDPKTLHVVIADQAGFHLPVDDARLPANLRLLPLPPYCPELNPVERFGGLLKTAVANRLYPTLRRLEEHLAAAARPWSTPAAVSSLIHTWLVDQVNSGAPA